VNVEYYLLLCRSVTYAQRTVQILERADLRCRMQRSPREVTGRGCAYAVRVAPRDLAAALQRLAQEQFLPYSVYGWQAGAYYEVAYYDLL